MPPEVNATLARVRPWTARIRSWIARGTASIRGADPSVRGMLWASLAGLTFSVLNVVMRRLSIELDPFQTQFLRYLAGVLVLLPVVLRNGLASYVPNDVGGQFWRGAVHTCGLLVWFLALPRVSLADTTAIGFTGPIFMMLGAAVVFGEPMRWDRWLAALLGFVGVMIVVGAGLGGTAGYYNLLMLASSPLFAASFLIMKALTRTERPAVIVVWQSLTVSLFSLPFALVNWSWPDSVQWGLFVVSGVLGSAGHYCMTRAFRVADVSATQPAKFLDLVWAALLGWIFFGDHPTRATLLGGGLILGVTIWLARRESRAGN